MKREDLGDLSAFLAIAEAEPARCAVIDATRPPDAVAEAIWAQVCARLGLEAA